MGTLVELTTTRLALRAFTPADAPAVLDLFRREAVALPRGHAPMATLAEAEAFVAARASYWERGIGARWAIALRTEPGQAIGSCGCFKLDRDNRSLEIGYELHPDHWRLGLMTEAVTAMLDYLYSEAFLYPLNRVQALTAPDNVASMTFLRRLGFVEEGPRREAGYWAGAYHDLRAFSLLRREWQARRAAGGAA